MKNQSRSLNSRRQLLQAGIFGAAGIATAAIASNAIAAPGKAEEIKVLNNALFYEHQAIWAYGFAAGKLTQSDVGKAVLAIALDNQADHKQHRDILAKVIQDLGGKPVTAQADYLATVKPYIQKGEGNLDSDVNIAKLALALEVDAAIAYGQEAAKLKTASLITAASSIGSAEACHVTIIRSAFKSLGIDLKVLPVAFVNAANRNALIVKV
jgi:rubrerythrin